MMGCMWHPPSPERKHDEVEEECLEVRLDKVSAIPFFTDESGKILIRGGTVVNVDGREVADVLIEDGKVVALGQEATDKAEADNSCKVIDASGKYVLPGGVDGLTRLECCGSSSDPEDPPAEETPGAAASADDVYTGSRAALIGGTTTIIQAVKAAKGQSLVQAFQTMKAEVEDKACCDVGFVVEIDAWDGEGSSKADVEELVKVHGVNTFLVDMGQLEEEHHLADIFSCCKALGAVVQVRPGNGPALREALQRASATVGGGGDAGRHAVLNSEEMEAEAAIRACVLADEVNVPLIITAATSRKTADLIADRKAKGHLVDGQVTIAALTVDGGHQFNPCWSHAAGFVTSPPLRDDPGTPAALQAAVASGVIKMVCSDHRAFSRESKRQAAARHGEIPCGVNGVEERMALAWKGLVGGQGADPELVVAATSSNAAMMLNVYPKKGRIAPGSDADVVIMTELPDPEEEEKEKAEAVVSCKTHHSAADFNVFEGQTLPFKACTVIKGGQVLVFDGEPNPLINRKTSSGASAVLALPPFPPIVYDRVQDKDANRKRLVQGLKVPRDDVKAAPQQNNNNGLKRASTVTAVPEGFGITTSRGGGNSADSVLNKQLGVYQRPISAHGIRNQQDSTFSLAGGYGGDKGSEASPRRSVKVGAPPGGRSDSFW